MSAHQRIPHMGGILHYIVRTTESKMNILTGDKLEQPEQCELVNLEAEEGAARNERVGQCGPKLEHDAQRLGNQAVPHKTQQLGPGLVQGPSKVHIDSGEN